MGARRPGRTSTVPAAECLRGESVDELVAHMQPLTVDARMLTFEILHEDGRQSIEVSADHTATAAADDDA